MTYTHTNRLIQSSSPYLLQHAHNPVDWWEWSEEAFAQARREDKLVLISIGYSACHWCHVMERESFEQEDTAAIMNAHFICIKVDREERPDIDHLYMDAVQLLTGQGGWPLNCFALPDGRPVHGGTYFPKRAWEHMLVSLNTYYHEHREEILQHATSLTQGIRQFNMTGTVADQLIQPSAMHERMHYWSTGFDTVWGGMNRAPKFPMPVNLQLFLLYGTCANPTMTEGALLTLRRMGHGGIFDQAGGGFCRYATDHRWKIPHFEKMLYDNGQLLSVYAHAYQLTQEPFFLEIIERTHDFLQRELTTSEGLWYAALDADSEGEEGRFYVWTIEEIESILHEDALAFCAYYGITKEGNWEHGLNILHHESMEETDRSWLHHCHELLMHYRAQRIRPGLDNKVIASWNALTIEGYVDAYTATGNALWLNRAEQAMRALLARMTDGTLLYRIRDDKDHKVPGFCQDYAALISALLALYLATGDEYWTKQAHEFTEACITRFYVSERNLFRFTASQGEILVADKYELHDDVIPSSNGMMAFNLYRLSFLYARTDWYTMSEQMLRIVQPEMEQHPSMYASWWKLAILFHCGWYQLVIGGEHLPEPDQGYRPNLMILRKQSSSTLPVFEGKQEAAYYLCVNQSCQLPETRIEQVMQHYALRL